MLYNNDSLAESSKNKMMKSGENKKGIVSIVREEYEKTKQLLEKVGQVRAN